MSEKNDFSKMDREYTFSHYLASHRMRRKLRHLGKEMLRQPSNHEDIIITDADIYKILRRIGENKEESPELVAARKSKYVRQSLESLPNGQRSALDWVAWKAGTALEVDYDVFAKGYALFTRIARDSDKVPAQLPYDFKEMISFWQLEKSDVGKVVEFERQAHLYAPVVCGLAAGFSQEFAPLTTAEVKIMGPEMSPVAQLDYQTNRQRAFDAGIGFAYAAHHNITLENQMHLRNFSDDAA